MADTPWTPGPWVANHNGHFWQIDGEHEQIGDACASKFHDMKDGDLTTCTDNGAANARLIAAAPEMHELLTEARSMLDSYYSEVPALAARIDALLSRVKGEANG